MNIYITEGRGKGYIDLRKLLGLGLPWVIVIGGRGTGKTYGALEMVVEDDTRFIFMRRTQSQLDIINKPQFSPFKKLNKDKGWNIGSENLTKNNSAFYHMEEIEGKLKAAGNPIGYTVALSTVANMRGFDATDVELLIYDEFIGEKHTRPIKYEASALFNAYETINRNRELEGEKPLQILALSNSDDLANPLFMELKLVRKAEEMKKKGQEISIDRKRGIVLVVLSESVISEQKADTALYRVTEGTSFYEMSLGNDFSNEEIGRVKSRGLKEYKPIVTLGEITIYRHKSKKEYYVSTHKTGVCPVFGAGEMERKRFQRQYNWIWSEYMKNNIEFEEYFCEILLTRYFD